MNTNPQDGVEPAPRKVNWQGIAAALDEPDGFDTTIEPSSPPPAEPDKKNWQGEAVAGDEPLTADE